MKQTFRSLLGSVVLLGTAWTAEAAAVGFHTIDRSERPESTSAAPVVGDAVAVFTEGEAGYAGFRIPVLVRADDGTLLAIAEARRHD